ncbi:MAG: conserved protein of unknown function [Nitrospira sp.]
MILPEARYEPPRGTGVVAACLVGLAFLLGSCETPNPRQANLPPSESDLALLKSDSLCERKEHFLQRHALSSLKVTPWGTGQEFMVPTDQSPLHGDESYFFDEDGILAGVLYTFRSGLDLKPYPTLRHTLSLLKPVTEFYLHVPGLSTESSFDSSALYETGDEKTTTQYLVIGFRERPTLLQASITTDPYVRLFSPYRREFLARLKSTGTQKEGQRIDPQGSEDKEPFASLQQFARGQAAQLSYCGPQNYRVAADAYQKAISSGFTNKVWQAEVHHKYGQALFGLGQYEKAKSEMLQSLAIRPNTPDTLNNLGSVYLKLGDKTAAQAAFEKAIILRPNYAIARFNLAETVEPANPKRALTEYETYLVLADGIPEEADRIALVQQRVKKLKH